MSDGRGARKMGVMARRAFTIVELLVVIAIIGVLLGIVTTAAMSSVKNARVRRAEAMGRALQQAIAAYHVQEGKWPEKIETLSREDPGERVTHTFEGPDADKIFQEIVSKSAGADASQPLIDVSALFVVNSDNLKQEVLGCGKQAGCFDNHYYRERKDNEASSYCGGNKCANGIDFSMVTKKESNKTSSKVEKIPISKMAFGWQGRKYGKFCRYWVTYNWQTDSVTVSRKRPGTTYPPDWE